MPSINLRLTDEQHAELERWAHDGHRSLQKEIIFRLFSSRAGSPGVDQGGAVLPQVEPPARDEGPEVIQASGGFITPQGREEAARVMTGETRLLDHFKPDPKPRKK